LKIKLLTILNRNDVLKQIFDYNINSIIPLCKVINESNSMLLNKIYRLAFKKQSNIILSVDLNNSEDIIHLIEETKENIIGVKIHSDIVKQFSTLLEYLNKIRDELIIIEDCKVADISFISIQKVKDYSEYADYITYHCLLGDDLPKSLKNNFKDLGLIGVVEMSVKGALIDTEYIKKCDSQLGLMDGCVIQKNGLNYFGNKLPITFSPGISLNSNSDDYNQSYSNPMKEKIGEFWIIGRSIYVENNRKDITTNGIFAPWLIHKDDFNDVKGHDPIMKSHSEDRDLFNRFLLNGYNLIQSWEALVYHLTCRGGQFEHASKTSDLNHKSNDWNVLAHNQTREFIRKWGTPPKYDEYQFPIVSSKYDVCFIIKNCNLPLLEVLEPWCSTMYVDCDYEQYVKREQLNTSFDLYERVKPYSNEKQNEILVSFDATQLNQNNFQYIQQLLDIIKDNGEIGSFELDVFKVDIIQMNEYQNTFIKV
jgi:orotidine-5'-phosphate decarboxylase